MQLICLVCSSFKKVFKASITDLRTPPTPSTAAPSTTSATSTASGTMGSTARTTSAEAVVGIRKDLDEVFEDELDDKRKTPDSLKEVLIYSTVVHKLFWCADHLKYFSAPRNIKYSFVKELADHLSLSRGQPEVHEADFGNQCYSTMLLTFWVLIQAPVTELESISPTFYGQIFGRNVIHLGFTYVKLWLYT